MSYPKFTVRSLIWAFIALSSLDGSGYEPFLSFSASKSELVKIYAKHRHLPLSGCRYDFDPKGCSVAGIVDFKSCDYAIKTDSLKAGQIDWMHVMQAGHFAKEMRCMREKVCRSSFSGKSYQGVRCCKQTTPLFKVMYADMHNIIPVVGERKTVRGQRIYGGHQIDGAVEPSNAAKGEIARCYLYMIDRYKIPVEEGLKNIWLNWHRSFPPSPWEKEKNRAIFALQGNENPYIETLIN